MGRRSGGIDSAVGVETLEPRLLMSGNVVVTMADGDVLVRGDRADNAVIVDRDGQPDNQLRIRGADGTTVNGAAEVILDDATHAVAMDLRGGDDIVTLDGVWLRGDLTVLGGRGDNAVVLIDVDIDGDVTVRNGRGADTFELTGASRIGDDLTIDNRSGGAVTTITGVSDGGDPPTITPAEIGGDVSLRNHRGATTTTLEHVTVGGDMDVRNRGGVDVLELLGQTQIGDDLTVRHGAGGSTTRLVGNDNRTEAMDFLLGWVRDESGRVRVEDFQLRGGRGADSVVLDYVSIESDFTVKTGGGRDSMKVSSTNVDGHTDVAMGGEADIIRLETGFRLVDGEFFGTRSEFKQGAVLDLGGGRDELHLGDELLGLAEHPSGAQFREDSLFTGGGGRDRLAVATILDVGIASVFRGFEPY